jgi:hypothetical protein
MLVAMAVKQAIAFPKLETAANARHVYSVAVFDGGFITLNLKMQDVYDVAVLTDEMYVIQGHVWSVPAKARTCLPSSRSHKLLSVSTHRRL